MYERELSLINEEQLAKIKYTRILIVGVGGVGGAVLEMLVRLGFHNITIIDNDQVSLSNLNRQILYNQTNLKQPKVLAAKEYCLKINPKLNIKPIQVFLTEENINTYLLKDYDYLIDTCDTITTKLAIIKACLAQNIKFISAMGSGNRFNPSALNIIDFWQISNDPVAKALRPLLRKNNLKQNFMAVASSELPVKIANRTPGSIALVPNTAGILCAYYVFNDIIKE